MLRIGEYANRVGVSYEAIRQQIKSHGDELKGHVIKRGRVHYLDDTAIEILDSLRSPRAVPIGDSAQKAEIERLRAENNELKDKLLTAHDIIIGLQGNLLEASKAVAALPVAQAEMEQLREDAKRLQEDNERLEGELKDARAPWWSRFLKNKRQKKG